MVAAEADSAAAGRVDSKTCTRGGGDVMTYQYGPVGRPVGRLAQTLERPDEAEQLLRDAVALCERVNARAFRAMARQDLGELLLPSPEGRRLVEHARAAANELGMPGLTKRAVAAHE